MSRFKKSKKILRKITILLFIAWWLQFLEIQEVLILLMRYSFRNSVGIEEVGRILKNRLYVIDILRIVLPIQLIKLTVQTGINSLGATFLFSVVERIYTEDLFDPADISTMVEVLSTNLRNKYF